MEMNKSKTKVMMETDTPIYVNNTQIENVESYIYLGQRYSTREKNKTRRFKEENMGTHHPCKEQASSHTNKDGKEYVKHHIPGEK